MFEAGAGVVLDGELHWLTGDLVPRDGKSIFDQIEESGAPALLLERYAGRLEYHDPWHMDRDVSHLFRGDVDAFEADALLEEAGLGHLRLVDNGGIHPQMPGIEHARAYHLVPAGASKAGGVAFHMRARGYTREECIAIGDSREDLGAAAVVQTFWLVANGAERDPTIQRGAHRQHPRDDRAQRPGRLRGRDDRAPRATLVGSRRDPPAPPCAARRPAGAAASSPPRRARRRPRSS